MLFIVKYCLELENYFTTRSEKQITLVKVPAANHDEANEKVQDYYAVIPNYLSGNALKTYKYIPKQHSFDLELN